MLAEFPSVINATECAVEIQTIMATRNEAVPESRRMLFRIGINLGDVIHDEARFYGDGSNVAARLEGIAEPGGICISRQVFDQVSRALKADFQALGPRTLKNIAQPVDVFAIAPVDRNVGPGVTAPNAVDLKQEIHFCTAPDGVQLAYSMIGQGPPLMKTGNWMTHLEFDLASPIWRHLHRTPAKDHTVWFNELQRMTVSGQVAARIYETTGETDVTALLPRVSVPTLVLHTRDEARVPFEAGRRMAAGIPGARFVALPGRNHLFLETEPAFNQFLEHTRAFLAA